MVIFFELIDIGVVSYVYCVRIKKVVLGKIDNIYYFGFRLI